MKKIISFPQLGDYSIPLAKFLKLLSICSFLKIIIFERPRKIRITAHSKRIVTRQILKVNCFESSL